MVIFNRLIGNSAIAHLWKPQPTLLFAYVSKGTHKRKHEYKELKQFIRKLFSGTLLLPMHSVYAGSKIWTLGIQ